MRIIGMAAMAFVLAAGAGAAWAQTQKPSEQEAEAILRNNAAKVTDAQLGKWQVDAKKSELGPSTGVATLDSEDKVPNTIGVPETATLVFRCKGPSDAVIYVAWPGFLGSEAVPVTFKFDDGPVEHGTWSVSDDGDAAGFWYGSGVANFIQRVGQAKRLVIAIPPWHEVAQETSFDLTGAGFAITKAAGVCLGNGQ